MPPATYLFIARSRVEQLHAEILAEVRDNIEAGLEPDPTVAALASAPAGNAEATAGRLAAITHYLERTGALGTVEEPASYFSGRMQMQWGVDEGTVLFVGQSQEKARHFVLLGGAVTDAFGLDASSLGGDDIPASAMDGLLALFRRAISEQTLPEDHYTAPDNLDARLFRRLPLLVAHLQAVQTVEFLAQTLSVEVAEQQRQPGPRDFLLVGAPLYVAVAP